MGKTVAGMVKKALPGFQAPTYVKSFDYARVGPTIVLMADSAYFKLYPERSEKVFIHHWIEPYTYLTKQLK